MKEESKFKYIEEDDNESFHHFKGLALKEIAHQLKRVADALEEKNKKTL